jgi:hypothetical protein
MPDRKVNIAASASSMIFNEGTFIFTIPSIIRPTKHWIFIVRRLAET